MTPRTLLAVTLLVLGWVGCSKPPPPQHPTPLAPVVEGAIEVGAAKADVTPPPGSSLYGHGPGARVAIGHWTRLYCRAFFLESAQARQQPLVIVACELPQISTVLAQRIAAQANELLGSEVALDASRVMVTATHTHAGPGHFFGVHSLNGLGSSLYPGFDPAMVEFIAQRAARAIKTAHDQKAPAELRWVTADVFGLSRNAAVWQTMLNCSSPDPVLNQISPCTGNEGAAPDLPEDLAAVDPKLRLLDLRRRDSHAPIGAMAFYALHPTFINHQNRYYHGDVTGVTSRLLEHELRRDQAAVSPGASDAQPGFEPVVAIVNTNEGDAQPARTSGDQAETIRAGRTLAVAIWNAHAAPSGVAQPTIPFPLPAITTGLTPSMHLLRVGPWASSPALGRRYAQVWLPNAQVPGQADPDRRLCPDGELGWASAKGTDQDPTVLRNLFPAAGDEVDWKRGTRWLGSQHGRCQRPKAKLEKGGFSREVPLAVAQLGNTLVSFLPAEATAATGALIDHQVLIVARKHRPDAQLDAVVAGLANGYIQYVATEPEYAAQYYDGSSTLYGPHSAAYFAGSLACLTEHLLAAGEVGEHCALSAKQGAAELDQATAIAIDPHPRRKRFWRRRWDHGSVTSGEAKLLCRLPDGAHTASGGAAPRTVRLCFSWIGDGPYHVMAGTRQRPTPGWLVQLQHEDGTPLGFAVPPLVGGLPSLPIEVAADDRDLAFTVRVHGREAGGWRWSSVIRLEPHQWQRLIAQPSRRIAAWGGPSTPFRPLELADCSVQQLRDDCLVEH